MPQNPRGYDFHELLSALQKDIRRGNEYQAVFWAVELESFNPTALWNVLEKEYDARRRENDSYRLFLVHAILFLARSCKSRIVDDFLSVVYGEIQHEDKKLPIPDYALDMHTHRGRKLGRSYEHFFSEGCKLKNEPFENPYTEKAKAVLIKYGGLKLPFKKEKKIIQKKVVQRHLAETSMLIE
jgi:replication-associated recombination protein RarA